MIIKNRAELGTSGIREQALDIIEAGITAVLPSVVMKSTVSYSPLHRILTIAGVSYHIIDRCRIFVIGGGKAAGAMAEALENRLGAGTITDGIVTCTTSDYATGKIRIVQASHPVPDERGVNGVQEMLALKTRYSIGEGDIVLCLLSGGGSALLPYPVESVTLADKQKLTNLLIRCGADITEINSVRKHLSRVKGGRLGAFFAPARVVSLIISDVVGNALSVIASGPTFPDSTTYRDAWNVLEKYRLLPQTPEKVRNHLEKGCRGEVAETPKSLSNCDNYIIADNRMALEAMAYKAKALGRNPCILTDSQTGDTSAVAQLRAGELKNGKYKGYDVLLIGGEMTPALPQSYGKGGRNQHYAATSLLALKNYPGNWVMACVGTDGSDFLPEVAGAIVDNGSYQRVCEKGIDVRSYLERFDSYTVFKHLGSSLIVTGNTGTNVGDIILYLEEN